MQSKSTFEMTVRSEESSGIVQLDGRLRALSCAVWRAFRPRGMAVPAPGLASLQLLCVTGHFSAQGHSVLPPGRWKRCKRTVTSADGVIGCEHVQAAKARVPR